LGVGKESSVECIMQNACSALWYYGMRIINLGIRFY
jgi:hypothetical protein